MYWGTLWRRRTPQGGSSRLCRAHLSGCCSLSNVNAWTLVSRNAPEGGQQGSTSGTTDEQSTAPGSAGSDWISRTDGFRADCKVLLTCHILPMVDETLNYVSIAFTFKDLSLRSEGLAVTKPEPCGGCRMWG